MCMKVGGPGESSYKDVMESLVAAEQEDVREETDPKWCRPRARKREFKGNKWVTSRNEWHEEGTNFSYVGLRGDISPTHFGWDLETLPDGEMEGFKKRQSILVEHYAS